MIAFQRFWHDRKGATAMLMSIMLVPLLGTLAISVDYSHAVKQRSTLQQVVDATATALAKDTDALLLTPAQLKARALAYANAVSGNVPVDNLNLNVTADSDKVHIDADGTVKLTFAKILGADSLIVKTSVTVERSKAKIVEIALALDNTGSMSGEKIKQLKLAVKALVDHMSDKSKNAGTTRIALVPFATTVKTDPAWMPASSLESTPPFGWDGCVTDRNQPNDATDAAPLAGNPDTLFWWRTSTATSHPVSCGGLARIIPLTTDLARIRAAADTMIASGNTNVPIGVAWAWHALSPGAPLNQGSADGTKDLVRVMIVLTDGENTANRWGNNAGDKIDKRLTAVCNNVKATGILVYTIRVIDGDGALLRSCATSPTHYFNVTTASQLTPVFEQIASSLTKMRISK